MTFTAIIPARIGSSRLPNKNFRLFNELFSEMGSHIEDCPGVVDFKVKEEIEGRNGVGIRSS